MQIHFNLHEDKHSFGYFWTPKSTYDICSVFLYMLSYTLSPKNSKIEILFCQTLRPECSGMFCKHRSIDHTHIIWLNVIKMFVWNPFHCRKAFHNFLVNLNNPTFLWVFWFLVSFLEYEFWNYLGIKTFGSETKKQKISPVTLWRWWKSRNRTIFNIIRWVAGTNDSSTKRLMFQVLFFFIISCKILCKNCFNLFSYFL